METLLFSSWIQTSQKLENANKLMIELVILMLSFRHFLGDQFKLVSNSLVIYLFLQDNLFWVQALWKEFIVLKN